MIFVARSTKFLSYRAIGNRIINLLLNIILNKNVTDCYNTFRGFKRNKIINLNLQGQIDIAMLEMTMMALGSGLKLDEVPTIQKNEYVTENLSYKIKLGLSALWLLTKFTLNPKSSVMKRKDYEY